MNGSSGVQLPEGAGRLAVTMTGIERESDIVALKSLDAVMVFLEVPDDISRIHASRRALDILNRHDINVPVIHHFQSRSGNQEQFIIKSGSQVHFFQSRIFLLIFLDESTSDMFFGCTGGCLLSRWIW